MSEPNEIIDVAIIGAGVAGAYCAYRLSRETDQRVEIFEAEDRVGGRLWSYDWAEAGTMVELGGEAFSPIHAIVAGLTQRELKLPIQPHAPFNTLNRLFLRNCLLKPEDMARRDSFPDPACQTNAAKLRYYVTDQYFVPTDPPGPDPKTIVGPAESVANRLLKHLSPEVGASFSALLQAYQNRICACVAEPQDGCQPQELTADQVGTLITDEIYRKLGDIIEAIEKSRCQSPPLVKKALGEDMVPLRDLNLWAVIVGELGQECYELFRDAGYDNTSALSFNSVELMENLLIGATMGMASPNFWTIEGGFDRLPKALVKGAKKHDAKLHLNRGLTSIRRDATSGLIKLTFGNDGPERCARKVIFTVPVSAFDATIALEGFDPAMTEDFKHRRRGIVAIPAGKLYLTYPEPWWSGMSDLQCCEDALHGYANTDMPARAVYYKGLIGEGPKAIMTGALADGISADFWSAFTGPDATPFPGVAPADQRRLSAPVHMVSTCQEILRRMHKGALTGTIPEPELALYHEWRQSGAGWSAWKSGRDIHRESAFMRRPFSTEDTDQCLYCCGDSVAERHGWVENTLESAEAMLREAFNLNRAPWIPAGEVF